MITVEIHEHVDGSLRKGAVSFDTTVEAAKQIVEATAAGLDVILYLPYRSMRDQDELVAWAAFMLWEQHGQLPVHHRNGDLFDVENYDPDDAETWKCSRTYWDSCPLLWG